MSPPSSSDPNPPTPLLPPPSDPPPPPQPAAIDQNPPVTTALPSTPASSTSAAALKPIHKRDFGFLPIPRSRQHDPALAPEVQFAWTMAMNILFAGMATSSVMNLYYIQPMLVQIAADFGVSHDEVASIATLVQAGYGCGILFLTPLGDLVRRRALVLLLLLLTTGISIGLALSRSVRMLEGLSFVIGSLSVTPQIVLPWTADLSPSHRRARSMSITLSGLIFGLVLGRVISGVLAEYASWRDTYWFAVAVQGAMFVVGWAFLPDMPDKDIGMNYFQVLFSLLKFIRSYPTLVQACLVSFCTSAVFAGFWTTLTFLLSSDRYNYNPSTIGYLGLLGIIGALLAPQWGRLVDVIVPWTGQVLGVTTGLVAMIIALAAAHVHVAAVCVAIVMYDMGQQLLQVSSSYRIAGIDPKARARLNACFLLALFVGQTSGTAIMTKIYNSHGWTPAGGCAVAFCGTALLILLARGPHEHRWVGWRGGFQLLKREKLTDLSPHAITERTKLHKPHILQRHHTASSRKSKEADVELGKTNIGSGAAGGDAVVVEGKDLKGQ